jgi:hypothetical protein
VIGDPADEMRLFSRLGVNDGESFRRLAQNHLVLGQVSPYGLPLAESRVARQGMVFGQVFAPGAGVCNRVPVAAEL